MRLNNVWFEGQRCDLTLAEGVLETAPSSGGPSGGCASRPFAEPHVHLDAALLGRRAPNRSGTLVEGIRNWARLRAELTEVELRARALQTIEMYKSWGCTRIRTHVDTGSLLAVEVLCALRDEVDIELQVVAFPQEGILRAPGRRQAWEAAVQLGVDAVGAIPHFERTTEEGWQSLRLALDLAERHGLQVDVHCDETDDPGSRNLEVLCALAIDRGYGERIVAGHCTAMHSYPNPYAAKLIALVVESGVQVVCNPLDNIVLQGRYDGYPKVRGLTRVDELVAAGACVGIGHDSVIDPWYRLGTANMLDPAMMLVHAGHMTSEEQMLQVFRMLGEANHRCFDGPPPQGLLHWPDCEDPVEVLRTRERPCML